MAGFVPCAALLVFTEYFEGGGAAGLSLSKSHCKLPGFLLPFPALMHCPTYFHSQRSLSLGHDLFIFLRGVLPHASEVCGFSVSFPLCSTVVANVSFKPSL